MSERNTIRNRKDYTNLKWWISTGILALGMLAVGTPILNHDISKRILTAPPDGHLSCPPELIEQYNNETNPERRVLIVLGAGMKQIANGEWIPNSFEEGRLEAAVDLYLAGYTQNDDGTTGDIFIQDGILPEGVGKNKTSRYFTDRVETRSGGSVILQPSEIMKENVSVNTDSGMEVLKMFAEKYGWNKFIIVTDEFHKQRVIEEGIEHDLCVDVITVEEAAELFDPSKIDYLDKRSSSSGMNKRKTYESINMILHMYWPALELRTWAKSLKAEN